VKILVSSSNTPLPCPPLPLSSPLASPSFPLFLFWSPSLPSSHLPHSIIFNYSKEAVVNGTTGSLDVNQHNVPNNISWILQYYLGMREERGERREKERKKKERSERASLQILIASSCSNVL
jgi:hypothetical protein